MPKFSQTSLDKLKTCHPDIVLIMTEAIKITDFTVLEGARPDALQLKYFKEGKSKLDGINKKSKHQVTKQNPLSFAVDVAPYPLDFSNTHKKLARFYFLAGIIVATAERLKSEGKITHSIRWGGDWDSDHDYLDNSFDDLPHFELV